MSFRASMRSSEVLLGSRPNATIVVSAPSAITATKKFESAEVRPAFTYTPSAQRYTSLRSERSRWCHAAYCACHVAFRRTSELAESGARVAQEPAQRELEITKRQAVQVELGQKRAHFRCATLEQWEESAHETLLHVAYAWAPHGNRAVHQRELPRFPMPVARARRRIQRRTSLRLHPPQQLRHFVLQELLHESCLLYTSDAADDLL